MSGGIRGFHLRDKVKPMDLLDIGGTAVSAVVSETAPGAAGYAASPHSLDSAHHTGELGDNQAPQFAFMENEGTDRPAYNSNRLMNAMAHVVPNVTDTYDIGTAEKWWRQMYVSQINGAVFAENVIEMLGGYFVVGHGQGTLDTPTSYLQVETATVVGTITAGVAQVETATITGTASSGSSAGTAQVETVAVVGPVTTAGYATVVVTADGMINSPISVNIDLPLGASGATAAGLIRDHINANEPYIAAFFTVSVISFTLLFTANTPAANDVAMNISLANGTCAGLVNRPTSVDNTAGVAPGGMTVAVTASGMTGSPVSVVVPFVSGTTASQMAALVRSHLSFNAGVAAWFTVGGSGADLALTRKSAAANDGTMNIAISGASVQGFDDHATSTDTTAGVVSGAGNASAIVTADGMTNSPKTVTVAVAAGDTASQVAVKIEDALEDDADVSAFFTVASSTADVALTAIAYRATNDATMNIAIDNSTCTGLTAAPTSANTTVGGTRTTIDFGGTLAVNDFVLIKGHDITGALKTEYMQVTAIEELVTNGTFTSDISGWTDASDFGCSAVWFSGQMSLTSSGTGQARARQMITTEAGKAYTLTFTAGGALSYAVGTSAGGSQITSGSDSGAVSVPFTATGTTTWLQFAHGVAAIRSLDDVSVQLTTPTRFVVTRDVATANSPDPVWAEGTPWLNRGYTGDGCIELNAYDSPRMSLFTQGATYGAQTEVIRIGDLNAGWGYGAETYGVAIGQYASGYPNITIDPTNGLRIRNYETDVLVLDTSGNANLSNKLKMLGSSSAIAIGTTPPTSASAGTGIWIDRTGIYGLASNTKEFYLDAATGKGYFGGGTAVLDASGMTLTGDLVIQQATTSTGLITKYSLLSQIIANPASSSNTSLFGLVGSSTSHADCAQNLRTLVGVYGESAHNGSGAVTDAYGLYANVFITGGGSITTSYGLYINPLEGSTKYGIYQEGSGDTNVLVGGLNLGTATGATSGDLKMSGTIEIDGDLNHDGSNVGFFGTAPAVQQNHIADADGGAGDLAKFNALLAAMETYGLLKTS